MKKIAKKSEAAPAQKWTKPLLSALLDESKEKFYALAHRYGLEVKSETGRWRKSPTVIEEILEAQKGGKGYLPVPRDTTIPDSSEKSQEEEGGDAEETSEETPSPKSKKKDAENSDAPPVASLDTKNALMVALCLLEHALMDMLRGMTAATEAAMREVVKMAGKGVDLGALTTELMDESSSVAKFVQSHSLGTGDLALNALIRATTAT